MTECRNRGKIVTLMLAVLLLRITTLTFTVSFCIQQATAARSRDTNVVKQKKTRNGTDQSAHPVLQYALLLVLGATQSFVVAVMANGNLVFRNRSQKPSASPMKPSVLFTPTAITFGAIVIRTLPTRTRKNRLLFPPPRARANPSPLSSISMPCSATTSP
jgi:hypothetical protein